MPKELTVSQLRDKLLKIWTECDFGVKERVKNVHSHRTIHYVLSTPSYSKRSVIEAIIKTIEEKVEEVKTEVEEMGEKVNEIINK